jgi:rod shape-determining protein MreC
MARPVVTRKSHLLLAGLVLAHLVIISKQVDGGSGTSLLARTFFSMLSPLQSLAASALRAVAGTWSSYVDLRHLRKENQHLKDQLAVMEGIVQLRQQQAFESQRLRELMQLRQVLPLATLAADVIARDGAPWFRTLTIDKGTEEGVRLNAPVVSPNGVLGRIIMVGPHAARVQLLLDAESGAGVRIERSRITGVVKGQVGFANATSGDLLMKYVPVLADVVEGDVVITSGLDHVYPPGLVVGRVRTVHRGPGLFKDVVVAPSARFDTIEQVLVVQTPLLDVSTPQTVQ